MNQGINFGLINLNMVGGGLTKTNQKFAKMY